MKNITALAVLVIIVCAFNSKNPAYGLDFSKERNYTFLAGVQFGLLNGLAREIVYPSNTNTKGEFLSELLWEMAPAKFLGGSVDFGRTDPTKGFGFFSDFSFKIGIPEVTGRMEDRDWLSSENSNLTNYSNHTNTMDKFYWLDFTAGVSIPVQSFLALKTFLTVSRMHLAFTGKDGYYQYAEKTGPGVYKPIEIAPIVQLEGEVIRYKQDWLMAAPGFGLYFKLPWNFAIDMSFSMSSLTVCTAVDEHLRTKATYEDYTKWGIFMEGRGSIIYTAVRWLDLSFDFAYRHIGLAKGETFVNGIPSGKAGAGLSIMEVCFLAKFRL